MSDLFAGVGDLCDLCIAMAGRFHAHRECCQIRLLANAPRHQREQAYERIRKEGGELSEAAIKRRVAGEYKRLHAARTAIGRAALSDIKQTMKQK